MVVRLVQEFDSSIGARPSETPCDRATAPVSAAFDGKTPCRSWVDAIFKAHSNDDDGTRPVPAVGTAGPPEVATGIEDAGDAIATAIATPSARVEPEAVVSDVGDTACVNDAPMPNDPAMPDM